MINWSKQIRQLLRFIGLLHRPKPQLPYPTEVPTPPVVVVPPPVVEPEPLRPPTREEVLRYRGHLADIRDNAGRVMWTPSLHALPADVKAEWLSLYVTQGATHIPVGPFDAGEAYPGAGWIGPDLNWNPSAIRALLDAIMATRTIRGHGLIPVIFVDGGGEAPQPRIAVSMPTIAEAIRGIESHVIVVPTGWEPHDQTARDQWDAIQLWQSVMAGRPMPVLAWHGWPGRSNGASNDPYNQANRDPWLDDPLPDGARYGSGARFWAETPFDMFLYQIEPPRRMADAECGLIGPPGQGRYEEGCWLDGLVHAMARVGANVRVDGTGAILGPGWASKAFVMFETTTYWEFRGMAEPGVTARVNARVLELARHYGLADTIGFGTGLPPGIRE